jgi:Fur family peroxide stress response transcriptional regulator
MSEKTHSPAYDESISLKGFRFTKQRREVFDALMAKRDHPTAVEVFMRVKDTMPTISLATVYNCLETLTECGLVRHVNIDRQSSRYCANLEDHGHFFCDECGTVIDVPLKPRMRPRDVSQVPLHAVISHEEVAMRGLCPECATNPHESPKPTN